MANTLNLGISLPALHEPKFILDPTESELSYILQNEFSKQFAGLQTLCREFLYNKK